MAKVRARTSLLQWLILLFMLSPTVGRIKKDGICSIFAFVPFTIEFGETVIQSGSLSGEGLSYAFSHMAAALMAVSHFNDRNPVVVPELERFRSCKIQLKLDNSSVIDTGTLTKLASQRLFQKSEERGSFPCAIAGPFNDFPALELSAIAQAMKIPMVIHRGYNARLVSDFFNEFTSQVFPDMIESSKNLVRFLQQKGRTNYTAFLYALTDVNFQRRETLGFHLDKVDNRWTSSAYISPAAVSTFSSGERTPFEALKRIKRTGYRTIVVAMETSWSELEAIADAADALGMNKGNYMWVFFDTGTELDPFFDDKKTVEKLVGGSMWTFPLPFGDPDTDPFIGAWKAQGEEEIDRLNDVNPIEPGAPGYMFANNTFFQDYMAEYGSRLMYDAVMTIGIGACQAQKEAGKISGDSHLKGVRAVDFAGASGRVAFGNNDRDEDRLGTRVENTVGWGVFNIRRSDCVGVDCIKVTDYQQPDGTLFQLPDPFIFADGTTEAPPLIDDIDMNYLSTALRAVGLTLMSIAMALAVLSAIFVFLHRKQRVLTASQPPFLYLVCFGAFVEASAIFTISFDEGAGWNEDQLSKACMACPWVLCLGHIVVYSALFTKMWRVHKVLQFKRRQIKMQHFAWPILMLVLSAVAVLTSWTILDPLVWNRVLVDSMTLESIGECSSNNYGAFVAPLAVLSVAPMIVTGYFAWKTKDVDDAYTESRWIFILFLVQLEVMVIATPIVVLLQDVSAEGRYFGLALMFWVLPMSTLGLIILPKYISYRRAVRGVDADAGPKRGETVGTRISGMKDNSKEKDRWPTVSSESRQSDQQNNDVSPAEAGCTGSSDPSDEMRNGDVHENGSIGHEEGVTNKDPTGTTEASS